MGTGLPRQTLTSCFLVSGHVALTLVPFAPADAKSKMMKRKKGNQESQAPSDPGPRCTPGERRPRSRRWGQSAGAAPSPRDLSLAQVRDRGIQYVTR